MSWSDLRILTYLLAAGLAVTTAGLLLFRWCARRSRGELSLTSDVLLGIAAGGVTFCFITYLSEGFEHGIEILAKDPLTWAWLAAMGLGGAALGWGWHVRSVR